MFFVKALSTLEDAPPKRQRWLVEVDEVKNFKFFPKTYEELQKRLQEFGEYSTPLPVPPLMQGYDWSEKKHTALLFLTMRRPSGAWFHAILCMARVFIMNNTGETIDKILV